MFVKSRVVRALESQLEHFRTHQASERGQLEALSRLLDHMARMSRLELMERLSAISHPGALPTSEQDEHDTPIISFPLQWRTHEDARAWAREVLTGRPTFAVDGSQIPSQRAFSLPVALIQIGWYENRHLPGGEYEKDIDVEVLPPELVTFSDEELSGETDLLVGVRRFQKETGRLMQYMRAHAGDPGRPVVFFDGSLIVSFAQRLSESIRQSYIQAMTTLLLTSQETSVPLVGYIDTSYARDLCTMLLCMETPFPKNPTADANLLRSRMKWGDRTPAYICARDDKVLDQYDLACAGLSRQVAFLYLKTTAANAPARLEVPLWVLEAGRLDDTLDIVRAEVVVGNGYPYPLETADAVAVLTIEDRERFQQTFEQFARAHQLGLRYSRKALSKRQRRV